VTKLRIAEETNGVVYMEKEGDQLVSKALGVSAWFGCLPRLPDWVPDDEE
jgi:hypothetical protein